MFSPFKGHVDMQLGRENPIYVRQFISPAKTPQTLVALDALPAVIVPTG